jgi:hypothetical protein
MIRREATPDMQPLVKRLDELICATIPGLQYAVKWGKADNGVPARGREHRDGALARLRQRRPLRWRGLRPSSSARIVGAEPPREAQEPGGRARIHDAQVASAGGPQGWLEMRVADPKTGDLTPNDPAAGAATPRG